MRADLLVQLFVVSKFLGAMTHVYAYCKVNNCWVIKSKYILRCQVIALSSCRILYNCRSCKSSWLVVSKLMVQDHAGWEPYRLRAIPSSPSSPTTASRHGGLPNRHRPRRLPHNPGRHGSLPDDGEDGWSNGWYCGKTAAIGRVETANEWGGIVAKRLSGCSWMLVRVKKLHILTDSSSRLPHYHQQAGTTNRKSRHLKLNCGETVADRAKSATHPPVTTDCM